MIDKNTVEVRQLTNELITIKIRLDESEREMKSMSISLIENTQATQDIANNTKPFLDLYKDLEAGTRFLCRCALAIRWILETVKNYYIPVVILTSVVWAISHNNELPQWLARFL